MEGLCQLIGADSWVWTLGCQMEPGADQIYVSFMHDGFDDARYVQLLEALDHPKMGPAVAAFYQALADTGSSTTMLRVDVDPQGIALSDGPRELWERADIGPLILSGYPLDERSLSAIAVYRRLNDPAFTERERQIAHIVLEEVPWLHMDGWPEDRGAQVPKLSPRQRRVLNLLLDGFSRKHVADRLKISENTVAGYAKEVYRHFGVNSQAELMHKFLSGSG